MRGRLRTLLTGTAIALAAILLLPRIAMTLPAETPDTTPMVNGPVRAIAQVGNNVWVGGNFSQVQSHNGTFIDDVRNLAVFDSETGQYKKDVAPVLGNAGSPVRDMEVYGGDVVVGGSFGGPSSTQKNLVVLNGTTGNVVRWYNSQTLQSVLAAPALGRIYGGGDSLSAFGYADGQKLWTRSKTTVNPDLRSHSVAAGYRDLELDGSTIWAACACDAVDGQPTKAMVKLSTDGVRDPYWAPKATGIGAFGISLVDANGALYLGAGGNDFLAQFSKVDGSRAWWRDTSGSAQAVEVMDGKLVVGGHFVEVADNSGDRCGFRSSNPSTLDPYGECQTRRGLAAYSFDGRLDPNWNPTYAGKYDLVWALHADGTRLHTGGEFLTVNGIKRHNYARFS